MKAQAVHRWDQKSCLAASATDFSSADRAWTPRTQADFEANLILLVSFSRFWRGLAFRKSASTLWCPKTRATPVAKTSLKKKGAKSCYPVCAPAGFWVLKYVLGFPFFCNGLSKFSGTNRVAQRGQQSGWTFSVRLHLLSGMGAGCGCYFSRWVFRTVTGGTSQAAKCVCMELAMANWFFSKAAAHYAESCSILVSSTALAARSGSVPKDLAARLALL